MLPIQLGKSDPIYQKFFKNEVNSTFIDYPAGGIMFQYDGHPRGVASELRVLGIAGDVTACGHFRTKYPLMVLASQGAKVCARVVLKDCPLTAEELYFANVIILQRAADPTLRSFVEKIARLTKATVIYDLDDYLHGVSSKSPAFTVYNTNTKQGQSVLTTISDFLGGVHGVTFSTRELQAAYSKDVDYSHVLVNGLDTTLGDRDWDDTKPKYDWRSVAESTGCAVDSDSLLFMFAGGSTHSEDLEQLGSSVAEILAKTKNTFFGICTNPHLAKSFCVDKWNLPLDRIVSIPTTQFKDFPQIWSASDINIAPLSNTIFNQCKSNLRLLEGGAFSTPYVCSKVASYFRFHQETEGKAGELVLPGQNFAPGTIKLLQNKDLREEKGAFIREYVRANYDIRKTMGSLVYTIKAIEEKRYGKLALPSFLDIQDAVHNRPRMIVPLQAKDKCPCGSGKQYKRCMCAPAYGRV